MDVTINGVPYKASSLLISANAFDDVTDLFEADLSLTVFYNEGIYGENEDSIPMLGDSVVISISLNNLRCNYTIIANTVCIVNDFEGNKLVIRGNL
jgi:hypothetical protein